MVSEHGSEPSTVEVNGYESLSQVVNLLHENGIPKDDIEIEAGQLESTPYRRNDRYEFNSTLRFDLADLDKIDTFRRAVVEAGGTSFRISGYGNRDEDSIYDNAYRDAINTAKIRAEKLLYNQPVRIGKVLNLHENIQETIEIIATAQNEEILTWRSQVFNATS